MRKLYRLEVLMGTHSLVTGEIAGSISVYPAKGERYGI